MNLLYLGLHVYKLRFHPIWKPLVSEPMPDGVGMMPRLCPYCHDLVVYISYRMELGTSYYVHSDWDRAAACLNLRALASGARP